MVKWSQASSHAFIYRTAKTLKNYCCPIKLDNNKNSVLDC